jgi:hypothetical protein
LTRAQERAATATAALLLQLLFITLLTHFLLTPQLQRERAKEVLLLLRPSVKPAPPQAAPVLPQQPSAIPLVPPIVMPPLLPDPGITGVLPQAPSGLEGLGRALSGCTPEAMGKLAPEDRAKCPPLAAMPAPDQDLLAPPRSHAKDEALWAEEKAEREWMPSCEGAEVLAKCMMRQGMAESDRASKARAAIDEQRRRRAQPPPPPKPKWFGPTPPAAH